MDIVIDCVLVTEDMIKALAERGITYKPLKRQQTSVNKPKSAMRMLFENGCGYFI